MDGAYGATRGADVRFMDWAYNYGPTLDLGIYAVGPMTEGYNAPCIGACLHRPFVRQAWLGGGVEAKLAPHWVARGEIRYASFGTVNATDVRTTTPFVPFATPLTVNYSTKVTQTMATIGLSYLWGGPAAPIYTKY